MTYPDDVFASAPDVAALGKANWLGRYLAVDRKARKRIASVLKDAQNDIYKRLIDIDDSTMIGKNARRVQYRQAIKQINATLHGSFTEFGDIISDGRQNAAVAAVAAGNFDDRSILNILFPNKLARQEYIKSLEQTARRNIEATVTRELVSKRTLSERVWKTHALSQGLVSKEINRGLARGDSAKDIAKSVERFVDPNTPGGVSYAAMRLGRTEINNAFHAQAIADAREKPWTTEVEWHLSNSHPAIPCECEALAMTKTFPVDKVPSKPHPQCLCYITPVNLDYDAFEDKLLAGEYDDYLDAKMEGTNYEVVKSTAGQQLPEIPPRWERYYEAMQEAADESFNKGVVNLPTKTLWRYREYDRSLTDPNTIALKRVIMENGKIKTPVVLEVNEYGGMIGEGNHRLAVAKSLGIKQVPTRIVRKGLIQPNDITSRGVTPHLKDLDDLLSQAKPVVKPAPTKAKAVRWTGPKVTLADSDSIYTPSDKFVNEMWTDMGFDARKAAIRRGAQHTQLHGWDGKFPEIKLYEQNSYYSSPKKGADIIGKQFVARAINEPPTETTLFRGYWSAADDLARYQEGQRISMPLSSFSSSKSMARNYITPDENFYFQSLDIPEGAKPILYRLEPGARAVNIGNQELLSFGQFDVVKVKYARSADDFMEVTLRQISMLEDIPDRVPSNWPEVKFVSIAKSKAKATGKVRARGPLKWTGPKMAQPLDDYSEITDLIDNKWQLISFDEDKYYMRLGARDAQRKGYMGFPLDKEQDYLYAINSPGERAPKNFNLKYLLDDDGDIVWDVTDVEIPMEDLKLFGKELTSRAVHNAVRTQAAGDNPLYRGIAMNVDDAAKLLSGEVDDLSFPLSSFTEKPMNARNFAFKQGWVSKDAPDEFVPVVFKLDDGARVAWVAEQGMNPEFVAFGQFHITSVAQWIPEKGSHWDDVLRRMTFDPGDIPRGIPRGQLPIEITIKQTSMVEHAVETQKSAASIGLIKEVELIPKKLPPKLKWDGPKIAKALDMEDEVNDYFNASWTSTFFDETKDTIRLGARHAQTNGYNGFQKEIIEELQDEIEKAQYGYYMGGNVPPDNALFEYGKELVARTVHNGYVVDEYDEFLRGLAVSADDFDIFLKSKGSSISLPLSSFTDNESLANTFAWGSRWKSRSVPIDHKPIIFKLESGAKLTEITPDEFVGFGKFKITDVIPGPKFDPRYVSGAVRSQFLDRNGIYHYPTHYPTTVVLKQYSMREAVTARIVENTAGQVIPDYQFIAPATEVVTKAKPVSSKITGSLNDWLASVIDLDNVQDARHVGIALEMKYPQLAIEGIDDIPLHHAKELGHAIDDMMTAHPQNSLRSIIIQDLDDVDTYAWTTNTQYAVNQPGGYNASQIALNKHWFADPDNFENRMMFNEAEKFHVANASKQSYRSTFIHEFGHVLDYDTQKYAAELVQDHINNLYQLHQKPYNIIVDQGLVAKQSRAAFKEFYTDWKKWLKANAPSGYSFTADGGFNPTEALAEAFTDVVLNGKKAKKMSREIYDILIREWNKYASEVPK